jgi:hypothetical protein
MWVNNYRSHPLSAHNRYRLSVYVDAVIKIHYLLMRMQLAVLRYADAVIHSLCVCVYIYIYIFN